MNEPLQIQVGEYEVRVDSFGNIGLGIKDYAGELTLPRLHGAAPVIAALATELAAARKDGARVDDLKERRAADILRNMEEEARFQRRKIYGEPIHSAPPGYRWELVREPEAR